MDLGSDGAPNLESDEELDLATNPEDVELPGPEPTMDRDPDAFQVMSAAKPGPVPPDVERELRQLSEALCAVLDEEEGVIATRYGRRILVAPVGQPGEAVDVADVDLTRQLVLTFGGEDPTDEGALLAKILLQRTEMAHGYARAPDVDGPTFSVLQKALPALHGPRAVDLEGIGQIALGHAPSAIAGAVQGLRAEQEDEEEEDETGPSPGSVNTV